MSSVWTGPVPRIGVRLVDGDQEVASIEPVQFRKVDDLLTAISKLLSIAFRFLVLGRHPAGFSKCLLQNEIELAVRAAHLVLGPATQGVQDFRFRSK